MNKLTPVEAYTPPKLPTLANKPPLSELPRRWARNAAVVACIGMLGASALAGCGTAASNGNDAYPTQPTTQYVFTTAPADETPLDITVHHGGAGGSPFYVARLTEQEALGILRAELEAAGLRFGAQPPAVQWDDIPTWWFELDANQPLTFYDDERNVGILFDNDERSHRTRVQWSWQWADERDDLFAQITEQVRFPVGLFYSPWQNLDGRPSLEGRISSPPLGADPWVARPPSDAAKTAAVEVLRDALQEQAQTFIAFLQAEGVL